MEVRSTFEEQFVPLGILAMAIVLSHEGLLTTPITFLLTFWYAWVFQKTDNMYMRMMSFGMVTLFVFTIVASSLPYSSLPYALRRSIGDFGGGIVNGGSINYTKPSPIEQTIFQAYLPLLVIGGAYIGYVYDGWTIFPNAGALVVFSMTVVNVWGYVLGFGRIIGVLDTVGGLSAIWSPMIDTLKSTYFLSGLGTFMQLIIGEVVLAVVFNFLTLLPASFMEVWA